MNIKTFHQPGHGASCDTKVLALQLMPDLPDAINLIVFLPNTLDLRPQNGIPFGAARSQVRVFDNGGTRIKCRLGDWQNVANRLDTQIISVVFPSRDIAFGNALPGSG